MGQPGRRRWRSWLPVVVLAALWLWQRARCEAGQEPATVAGEGQPQRARVEPRPVGAELEVTPAFALARLPWTRPSASVRGQVRAETGAGIADASVCASLDAQNDLPAALLRPPRCTVTDAHGNYRLDDVPPVRVSVVASAVGYLPAAHDAPGPLDLLTLAPAATVTGIDIVLVAGGVQLRGIVRDLAGGVIEGATVEARALGTGRNGAGRVYGTSDAAGTFRLWVAPATVSVTASAEGYTEDVREGVAPGLTVELWLTPESSVSGRVVGPGDDTPAQGASVRLEGGQVAVSDDEGRYRFDGLDPGVYKPSASLPGAFGQLAQSVHLDLGQHHRDADITLHAVASLGGRIIVADTQPPQGCAHGYVLLAAPGGGPPLSQRADAEGVVQFDALLPGRYEVTVQCGEHVPEPRFDPVTVAGTAIDGLTWQVRPGQTLRGQVVDSQGQGLAGVEVHALPRHNDPGARVTTGYAHRTGEDGRFTLAGLLPGVYEIHARHRAYVTPTPNPEVTVAQQSATPELRIMLEAGGTIRGHVRDAKGRPVAGVHVETVGPTEQSRGSMSDDAGAFELRGIVPGRSRVVARRGFDALAGADAGPDDIPGIPVQVRRGEVIEVELVVTEQRGRIHG